MSQAKRKLRVLMYMQNYYSAELHRGVAQFAKEQGWSLNTSMYRSGHLPNRKWDGIVGSFLYPDSFYESYVKPNRIPAVSLTWQGPLKLAHCR